MPRNAPRIAVLGSCITRDLWPIRGGGAQNLYYVTRTSLPSLFAPPVAGFMPPAHPPGELRDHQRKAVVADLRKTALAGLVAFRPTHVILDLIDERYDLLSVAGSLVSDTLELRQSGYLRQPALAGARRIRRLSAACDRLWTEAAEQLAALVRATPLADARLILHSARWATCQRMRGGELAPIADVSIFEPVEIADHNAMLARYEAVLETLMPPMARVEVDHLCLADPYHHWGLSPFHYVPEYYEEARRRLEALGLEGAFSARQAAPSAPAA